MAYRNLSVLLWIIISWCFIAFHFFSTIIYYFSVYTHLAYICLRVIAISNSGVSILLYMALMKMTTTNRKTRVFILLAHTKTLPEITSFSSDGGGDGINSNSNSNLMEKSKQSSPRLLFFFLFLSVNHQVYS